MIPPLGLPPLQSPATIDQPSDAMVHPLAPKIPPTIGPSWQRWFTQLFRAVSQLIGSQQDPAATVANERYRWKSVLRVSMPQAALKALLAQAPPAFNAHDAGLLVHVSDYNHVLEYDGTKFQWGPGDLGSGWTAEFLVAPTALGWHLLDGTAAVPYLQSDGSLGTQDLPTTAGTYFRQ